MGSSTVIPGSYYSATTKQVIVTTRSLKKSHLVVLCPNKQPIAGVAHMAFMVPSPIARKQVLSMPTAQLRTAFLGVFDHEAHDVLQLIEIPPLLFQAFNISVEMRGVIWS